MSLAAVWRIVERLSLLVWGVMIASYAAGAVLPIVELGGQVDSGCYNRVSKIGTPLFLCKGTGADWPIEALLNTAWQWVMPGQLVAASLDDAAYVPIAFAWTVTTAGVPSILIRWISRIGDKRPA